MTLVSEEDLRAGYEPKTDDTELAVAAKRAVEGSMGMPVAVQLAALPWKEELLLRAMGAVEAAARFDRTQHVWLQPTPRKCPTLGAQPVPGKHDTPRPHTWTARL